MYKSISTSDMIVFAVAEIHRKKTPKDKSKRDFMASDSHIWVFHVKRSTQLSSKLTAAIKEGGGPPSPPSASPSLTTPFLCYPPPTPPHPHLTENSTSSFNSTFVHHPHSIFPPSSPSRTAPPFPLMGGVHPVSSCNLAGPKRVTSLPQERKRTTATSCSNSFQRRGRKIISESPRHQHSRLDEQLDDNSH